MDNYLYKERRYISSHVIYSFSSSFISLVIAIGCLSFAFNIINTQCTITSYQSIQSYSWENPINHDLSSQLNVYTLPVNIYYYRFGNKWTGRLILEDPDRKTLEKYINNVPIGTTLYCNKQADYPYFNLYHYSNIYYVIGWVGISISIVSAFVTISWIKSCGKVINKYNEYNLPGFN